MLFILQSNWRIILECYIALEFRQGIKCIVMNTTFVFEYGALDMHLQS